MKKACAFCVGFYIFFLGSFCAAVDLQQIENDLAGPGVVGWMHGDVPDQGMFVFTYRNPQDFFDNIQMSLVSEQEGPTHQLQTLHRHDKVRIKGAFLKNPSPQKHILVSSVELIEAYTGGSPDEYGHEAKLPEDLLGVDHATFLVHAVASEGHILVVEYRDTIVPIFVQNADLTKSLYRNDLVELKIGLQTSPDQPVHLRLSEKLPEPVKVLESLHEKTGQPIELEGALIMFPKSPEIIFNVFALQQELPSGLSRQYTLVNFDSPDEFAKIRKALQDAWDRHPGDEVNGRNKRVSLKIRVRAKGTLNEISPNQANPQILLESLDALQIIETP